ncbi:MAG: prolyl-tRNA synthetase associated domain-containing protein [Pseudomonadota bacterium]
METHAPTGAAEAALQDRQNALFAALDRLGVPHETIHHPPIFTVEEGRKLRLGAPGAHTKNLFVSDKAGAEFLIMAEGARRANLKAVARALGAGRFSFVKPPRMLETLGVAPGSVTALALMNAAARGIQPVIDAPLLKAPRLYCHPLVNTASTALRPADLMRFLESFGFQPTILDIEAPG